MGVSVLLDWFMPYFQNSRFWFLSVMINSWCKQLLVGSSNSGANTEWPVTALHLSDVATKEHDIIRAMVVCMLDSRDLVLVVFYGQDGVSLSRQAHPSIHATKTWPA
mmetsp:Transcript_64052/g.125814  ORF Transcript_64052/g.125814 Transcript_64052/m.125814 type:complete len:107 (-) Transcript_64052:14-334(-)